jgi:ubiquinone/menaquinone biosynthesis C-methylase UbiE
MTTAALFDSLAPRYDELWTDAAVGRAQRNAVWRVVDPLFRPGDRILDIGCGTGADAAHYAARGVRVYATDASASMIAVASARSGFTTQVLAAENLSQLRGDRFDGALSNFGALNCVEDLAAVSRMLGALIRPGGRLAICTMGRFCAWELLYYCVRLNFRKAFRRLTGSAEASRVPVGQASRPVHPKGLREGTAFPLGRATRGEQTQHASEGPDRPGGLSYKDLRREEVHINYPTVRELRTAFAQDFDLRHWTGIGMLVPPSYVKLPARMVNTLAAIDRIPILRACADHRLLIFERK